ncbi:MAG: DUF4832 domain-containing protein [Planctomycetes bacterium]|nr:DUF4832 domain-containing protein [Planctomycetota bacterium]
MPEVVRRVRPTPSDAYLGNPHKGCCTFQHFNGDEFFPGTTWSESGPVEFPAPIEKPIRTGYLPSTVSYCRWFWRLMEPEQGKRDFTVIDKALETCAQRGQTLAVRLMAFGSARQPQVPDWYQRKYPMENKKIKSAEQPVPIHDAPAYLEHWGGFVREFARRYDGNPLLESIDVTYIGPWGEGAGTCSAAQCKRFAELWRKAFKVTPRLCMIGGDQMQAGLSTGAGWRMDCYGDLKAPGSPEVRRDLSWNHHFEGYPREISACGATDAWKTAPVHFETCWVPMYWYQHGFDLDFILQQGLKFHGTYFMPKYTRLPDEWLPKLAAFCRTLGYRFVYRGMVVESPIKPRAAFRFQTWIENMGVAPLYRKYDFALRFRQGDREEIVTLKSQDPRKWLPGDVWIDEQVKLPAGFKRGWVHFAAGLVDPKTKQAKVRFAVKEQFSDGWVDLNGIEVL